MDWLLLFLSSEPSDEHPNSFDPIRVQKGMFLLSKRGPARDLYEFRPYNWGPFCGQVYSDLEALIGRGLVTAQPVMGRSWSNFRVTDKGKDRASELARETATPDLEWLARARHFVVQNSFADLLSKIYDAYPEYATRSKFSH